MIEREELFALAAQPIGSPRLQAMADATGPKYGLKPDPEVVAIARRASKIWLPCGKTSANTTAARDAERDLRAKNFDLEDAIAQAGGARGGMRTA